MKENEKKEKSKVNISKTSKETEDELDGKIWVTNKIEEAKEETEELICEKIKDLNYEKTINDINEELREITKAIKQVDYNKDRAIEDLEENFNIKLDDVKVIQNAVLENRIMDTAEENIKKSISVLEKKLDIKIKKISENIKPTKNGEIEEEIKNQIEDYKEIVSSEIEKLKTELINVNNEGNEKIKNIIDYNVETNNKLEEYSKLLETKIDSNSEEYQSLLKSKINDEELNAEIENLKNSITKLDEETAKQLGDIEEDLNNKIKEEALKREKVFSDAIKEIDISKIRENINLINEKVKELDTINQNKLEKLKKEQEKFIVNKVDEINEIAQNKLESFIINKVNETDAINQNKSETYITNKINELESMSQNKLEKFIMNKIDELDTNKKIDEIKLEMKNALETSKKKQEKLIVSKINELDTTGQINSLKQDIQDTLNKIESVEKLIHDTQENNFEELKQYVEKRILRMKFATTIQYVMKEINDLKIKIQSLQESQTDEEDEDPIKDIDYIVEQKVKEVLERMVKEQKEKKRQATQKASTKNELKKTQRVQEKSIFEPEEVSPFTQASSVAKTLSTAAKVVRKSQILNFDN